MSSPKLVNLFCIFRCFPLLCYTLVLSLLLLGVGFKLSLISFWGCLRLILHASVCFMGSIKPFRMWLGKLFAYPFVELFKIWWTSQRGSFSSYYHVGVCAILEEVIQVSAKFMHVLRGLWWMTGLFFKKGPLMPHVLPIPTTIWMIFQPPIFQDV
jgi:hypothetical protein